MFKLLVCTLIVLVITVILVLVGLYIYKKIVYVKSDNSKKAYILMERLKKKYKINPLSYRDMINVLSEKYGENRANEIVSLAEKCIFSEKVNDVDVKKLERLI